ncbi:MAG TPA: alanine--tRNA ligase [Thiotrichales bacterium]|nr:alanine--tRNA ligase [Thiotrichales bacterium]
MKSSAEIRSTFLEFFRQRGHEVVPSSSLVPANDPTLLFTNAGMVQFKDLFLGREKRPYTRACSAQRCVRAGGKHNDLENVGYTARHHTFFEMLGNFSFGDYFKREAIHYAWELLTEVYGLPAERLWVTVYQEDDEAAEIWLKEIGVDPARFTRIGDKPGGKRYESDNFWSMGDTGPCGPCTEIFYDHGPEIPGGPPGTPEEDGDRYVEIWNLVFMQYDRAADGTMKPLPKPSVDTGMGLERLAAVLQGVHSNYDIDLFRNLIRAAAEATGCDDLSSNSLKVIADHIRSCAFLIVDGVLPSNEGRGYVLRRIIRRAIRHGHKLDCRQPFFHRLVGPLEAEMGDAYPELREARAQVEQTLLREEQRFAETLDQGLRILDEALADLEGEVIPGELAFRLYDTYGFPVDLTADIARERGLSIDMEGFEREMERQRERARAAGHFSVDQSRAVELEGETEFTGYDRLADLVTVEAILHDGRETERLSAGQEGVVYLDHTPFYAESGGQVGDTGRLVGEGVRFRVTDTRKQGAFHAHFGVVEEGALEQGARVEAKVDEERRRAIALNHSATHLLHAALRKVLGSHVAQKGSLVEPDRLRFDFSHDEPLTAAQLREIEVMVNREIRSDVEVETRISSFDEAVAAGAMALFGEKYGERVRVLKMGDFSVELCGGTHVHRLGEIGLFKIVAESGIAAGVRRIEAVTGEGALEYLHGLEERLGRIATLLKSGRDDADRKVEQLLERSRRLEKEVEQLKAKLAHSAVGDLAARAREVGEIKVVAARLDGVDPKSLRDSVDRLKNQLGKAAVVLAAVNGEKVSLVAGVTKAESARLRAGDLVNFVARQVGGKGGGRPDMAQAGGNDPSKLDEALSAVAEWVAGELGAAG